MRKAAILVGMACAVTLASNASAEVRFRGVFTITAVKNCIARYVGETFSSAYRPAGVGNNPNVTSLTQFNQFSGDVYELAGEQFKVGTWHAVKGHGIDNLHYEFDAQIRLSSQTPAQVNGKTNFVSLVGIIRNAGNDPGENGLCVATFRGSYFRRVE